ncbi:ribonuclease HI family protein [Candidatus Gracilibacteria bacterium]|nr:ribonuclease HI family protein [Candidatus Gracilibacteria bacterium]NJM90434.1 ribonuclease HI family protein [Hydrococcus sp. RU_2_2]NJP21862.1 ribonuclease HI family protein [Hydrococcus sp. CRU_1_1]
MKKATLYFDGGTYPMNPGHGGAGAVLVLENGENLSFSQYLGEKKTNNQAEYGGLLLGLRKALEMDITHLKVYGDSQLVIYQVNGDYACHNEGLYPLYQEARSLVKQFQTCSLSWIPREQNSMADTAATEAIRSHVPQAVVSMPDNLPVCSPRAGLESSIATLNSQGEGARFKAWLQLKSGNDCFSKLRGEKLIAQVPESVREAIESALTEKELSEGLLEKCYRWYLRGLKAAYAVKKIRVDAEVAAKFAQK